MSQNPSVLIVGAGSMGIIMGYLLETAGANITYLIRPHRAATLAKPQVLYNFKDNSLKDYNVTSTITDPSMIKDQSYDYILITLDGAALRNETGTELTRSIGDATRGTGTKIILGSVAFNSRAWFLQTSGLAEEQVTNGWLVIHAYSPKAVTLPIHEPADPELVAKADLAYIDALGQGFLVDGDVPFAQEFADLYNSCAVSKCVVQSGQQTLLMVLSFFPVFAVSEILGWPSLTDLSKKGELWSLAVAATKEIQSLGLLGEAGKQAAASTSEEGLAAQFAGLEQVMRPLDLQEFNRYHHGGKVNVQDRALLRDCLAAGEAEGKGMTALKELIARREAITTSGK